MLKSNGVFFVACSHFSALSMLFIYYLIKTKLDKSNVCVEIKRKRPNDLFWWRDMILQWYKPTSFYRFDHAHTLVDKKWPTDLLFAGIFNQEVSQLGLIWNQMTNYFWLILFKNFFPKLAMVFSSDFLRIQSVMTCSVGSALKVAKKELILIVFWCIRHQYDFILMDDPFVRTRKKTQFPFLFRFQRARARTLARTVTIFALVFN